MFVNNKSIFIHYDAKNPGKFQLYGNKYRANVIMERPGVYIIDDIYKNYNKEFSFSLIQLFGNIKFVLWKDATEINGNPLVKLESFKINDVFRAWDQYMAFEKRLYVDNLKEVGIIKFKSITINGDELTFDLEDNLDDKNLSQIEFEFISAFDPEIEGNKRILPQNIDQLIALKNKKGAPIIYLGKPLNEEMGNNKLVFPIPYKNFMAKMTQYEGYIYPSDRSLQVEQRRRKGVLGIIESKKNESSLYDRRIR